MQREFLVYCAGPISGLSFGDCTDWRNRVAAMLPPHIIAISPMRAKHYLASEECIANEYAESALSSQKGITCRDRMDTMRCDALLVNLLGAQKVSIGTVMEIAWADAFRKPIIIAMESGSVHDHAMMREVAGFIVPSLQDAVALIIAVLSPTDQGGDAHGRP